MQLVGFSYNDDTGQLEDLNLQSLNLIVGRNASGKSQTLYHLEAFTNLVSEKEIISWEGIWTTKFIHEKVLLTYLIEKRQEKIIRELLQFGEETLIDRTEAKCVVYSTVTKKIDELSPPADKLIIHIRRDTKLFSHFELLIGWAYNAYHFRFGSIIPYILLNTRKLTKSVLTPLSSTDGEYFADMFSKIMRPKQEEIISTLNDMGYGITHYGTIPDENNKELFTYKEHEEGPILGEYFLSQGTLRIFILLTYINYLLQHQDPEIICIDDLGEGLDYHRVVKVGKYIFDLCEKRKVQLIATSNDGFIMDVVPIDYWNVLRRERDGVRALNIKNSPNLFSNFAYTGLSNFDFFSSDYIDSHLK